MLSWNFLQYNLTSVLLIVGNYRQVTWSQLGWPWGALESQVRVIVIESHVDNWAMASWVSFWRIFQALFEFSVIFWVSVAQVQLRVTTETQWPNSRFRGLEFRRDSSKELVEVAWATWDSLQDQLRVNWGASERQIESGMTSWGILRMFFQENELPGVDFSRLLSLWLILVCDSQRVNWESTDYPIKERSQVWLHGALLRGNS